MADDFEIRPHRRFIVNATCVSPAGTMGGNTKICLEIVKGLASAYDVHVIVPRDKTATFTDNFNGFVGVTIHAIEPFKHEFLRPISCTAHFYRELKKMFDALKVNENDIVFSPSEIHSDSVVTLLLKSRFHFKWIASFFLFVPSPLENLLKRYRFPFFLYAGYWLYQRTLLAIINRNCDSVVITNDCDRRRFGVRPRKRSFAFYGGVNVEQIPSSSIVENHDVVFCSRLCHQKGIMGFLDIWREVVSRYGAARLRIIGNGKPSFERALRKRAKRLGIESSIDWLGYVNNEAKFKIYSEVKLFVHPTVYDNNGMVAAEALCSGLPVVMFDLPALRNVYNEGCVKVPVRDKAAFVNAIVDMLARKKNRLDDDVIKTMRERWSWEHRVASFRTWMEYEAGI